MKTEVHLDVDVANHGEAEKRLHAQARAYFGERPYELGDVDVFPRMKAMAGETVLFGATATATFRRRSGRDA